ncbi:uncharacterized protein [Aegilops tauschii subsp. strangulata]|uniref:uncharacterized protein n=1 Tax=Aegilops tauschii subsp. strangulata TaxID=200361 RepID=UPI00098A5C63|nr:uncharacterized protein LOC109782096 [Aegilops tauschii subsp. strangulata]
MALGSTTRQVWDSIAILFHDNKKSHALAHDAEFHNTPQGDKSIHDYCAKLKSLADALSDVGQNISDETLVLTVLRGLNEQFNHLRSFLPFQVSFPLFLQTHSTLVLEETQKKTYAKNEAATVLWASGNNILPHTGSERAPSPVRGIGYNGNESHNTSNHPIAPYSNPGRGGGTSGRRGRGDGRDNPWMFNPWTGLPTRAQHQQQAPMVPWQPRWRAPNTGVLGPRPGPASFQAYTAYGPQNSNNSAMMPPPSAGYPGGPQQHQLDPALLNAL